MSDPHRELEHLRKLAQANPTMRFEKLLKIIRQAPFLEMVWGKVQTNRGSRTPGIDGQTREDIEESIFLASRVLVMSARPGRIKADVRVDLPYPRHYTLKTSPEFSTLKARLTEEIRAEAVIAASGP